MKLLSLFLFAGIGFLNTSAFAFPTKGDNAVYDVSQTMGTRTLTAEMKMEVQSVDQSKDQVMVVTSLNGSAQPAQAKSFSELNGLINLVMQCTASNGTLETIQAANNSMTTCHIRQALTNTTGPVTGDIWFGKVPFGIVKSIVIQSSPAGAMTQTMLLKSFKDQ